MRTASRMPFQDIVGHRKIVALLARSIDRGTLPPSLIFAGPSGIGKRLTAVAVAQALNCPSGGCGTCASCVRIAKGAHPDVVIVEPGESGSIKIEQVRDVIERAAYRPFEGRTRVVIIDDADALGEEAQNALLKTLEEPPSASIFILVTSAPDLLRPTVLSRCPRLIFRALGEDDVTAILIRLGRPEASARAAAAAADGSVGQALDASAEEFVTARQAALGALGTAARSVDVRRRLEAAQLLLPPKGGSPAAEREHLTVHLRAMAALLRDQALLSTGGDPDAAGNADFRSALEGLTAFHGDRGTRAFAAVSDALAALERNAASKIVADWVMLQL
jgi:DNA polymerase III subunit delta'